MASPTLALLRERTATQHRALEALTTLTGPALSRADYSRHLRAMLGVVTAVETTFYRSPEWRELVPDHAGRLRADLIRADLVDLDGKVAALPAPVALSLDSFAANMGAAYVLEGSTLGGTVLARHVAATLGPDAPVRFLAVHGARVGEMWRSFCTVLEASIEPTSREDACRGAIATFEAFRASFASEDDRPRV